MIVTKAIKPKRLKVDAMRLALLNGMRKFGTQVKKEYEKTVSTWETKPKFDTLISLEGEGPTLIAGVSGGGKGADHWRYVNEGTGGQGTGLNKYPIPKVAGGKTLQFQSGYNAKTSPGLINSRGGGPYGDVIYAKQVMHPGIRAREFDKAISEEMEPRFKRAMEAVMKDAANDSGHEVTNG